jgi:arsenite oxidase small subunit
LDSSEDPNQEKREDQTSKAGRERRDFIKVAVVVSAALAVGGVGALARSLSNPAPGSVLPVGKGFPRVKVANLSSLEVNKPLSFYYPLDNEPSILVKLGQKAENGLGPDGDIVAFSQVCQHLGCIYGYIPPGKSPACNTTYTNQVAVGYCCCHGSVFDFTQDAKVIGGPAPRPQPRVILEIDQANDIYAVGMTLPTVFGHNTGSSDVTSDLQGGNLVS